MNKIKLLRKISLIHAAKCNKTESERIAVDSFNMLNEFRESIFKENDFDIDEKIKSWQNQSPVVTEYDIYHLLNNKE